MLMNQTTEKPKIRRKRRKKTKNYYFTKVHEKAIIDYKHTECLRKRAELYKEYIQPAFDEMVDKIVYTFKFTTLPNIDYLKEECKIWLITIIEKYNPEKAAAFSYFSVITKNWFIHKVKVQQKRNKREIDIQNISKSQQERYLTTHESYVTDRIRDEFWSNFYSEIKSWNEEQMKDNDLKVYKAIMILFESKDDIEIFNKKAIYLYLREITDLNTKQIVNSLKKFRSRYFAFKEEWDTGQL